MNEKKGNIKLRWTGGEEVSVEGRIKKMEHIREEADTLADEDKCSSEHR